MKYRINLLPKKELNITDKVIYFTFHYLRYILVITQLVVIGVFFYRFKVDQEIVDLKDTLQQKREIITVSQPILKAIHTIDVKAGFASGVVKQQKQYQSMMEYFLSIFPDKLSLTSMTIGDGSITFEGTTLDVQSVQIFLARLKSDGKFQNITLQRLDKTEFGYTFTFILKGFRA